ncbi:MAG: DUF4340 domain-containing protein [Treponema sp.]|nr:DUF4340 domain-containing protein [Treponema sp.]
MKARKLILIIADVVLLAVCILQGILSSRSGVKVFDISQEPDELIIEQPEIAFSIVKEGNDWFVGEEKYPANLSSVQNLVERVSSISALNKVGKANNEAALNRYEMNEGQKITVTVKSAGTVLRTLHIGKDSSTGTQGFVCFDNSNDIYLINDNLNLSFTKTPDDLRSKTIINFDKNQVSSVFVKTPADDEWGVFADDNGNWSIEGVDFELKDGAAADWAQKLCSLTTTKWYAKDAVLNGELTATIEIKAGKDTAILKLFTVHGAENDTYYGKCNLTPYPFEVASYAFKRFVIDPQDLAK